MPCIAKTYAPIGETPELECDSKNKEFISISGVISPNGYSYFEIREKEGFKQQGLLRFIDNVVADCREKISMIWDNASSHTSKTIKKYLKNQSQENPIVWLSNIPPYSPELNPIEQVWGYLKKKLANQFVKTTSELKELVTKTLTEIQNDKELIRSFFKHPDMECYQFSI